MPLHLHAKLASPFGMANECRTGRVQTRNLTRCETTFLPLRP